MDMFDRMGVADELIGTGIKTIAFQMYAGLKPLFRVPLGGVDAAFPFMLTTAQTETERVLGEHLQAAGLAVERGVEVVGLSQQDAGVHLSLRHADGASSRVRELVGTKLEGTFSRWRWLVADVDADHHLDLDCAHMFLSAEDPVVAMPMRGGRMRFLAQVHTPATPAKPTPTHGQAGETLLDSYNTERYPVAHQVLKLSGELTWAWQMEGLPRQMRDAVVALLSRIGPARCAMANAVEEVNINYQGSPIAAGDRPRGATVAAGEYLPHLGDPAVYKQLRAVLGADNLGQTIVTVASDHSAPAAGGQGPTQVLVTRDDTPVAGYDTVIADPHGALADRLGLTNGARVVVRPDGYIGAITTLDDTDTIADYFARAAG